MFLINPVKLCAIINFQCSHWFHQGHSSFVTLNVSIFTALTAPFCHRPTRMTCKQLTTVLNKWPTVSWIFPAECFGAPPLSKWPGSGQARSPEEVLRERLRSASKQQGRWPGHRHISRTSSPRGHWGEGSWSWTGGGRVFTVFFVKEQTEMRDDGGTGNGCSHLADTQRQEVGSGLAAKCTTLIFVLHIIISVAYSVNVLWPNQACDNYFGLVVCVNFFSLSFF